MGIVFVNINYIRYISDADVRNIKEMVTFFSLTHRNYDGLFVEPSIDASFKAADSVNFSQPGIQASNLMNPNNLRNSPVMNFRPLFFFDYIFDKQNFDGSYSDIVGFGNMFSTYEAIKSIDLLNSTYLNYLISQGRTSNIVSYLINSLNDEGWGFKLQPSLNDSDIISTSNAIDLSKSLHATALLNNENITRFINSTWFQIGPFYGGYRYSNNLLAEASPESSYFGIKANLGMNNTYDFFENTSLYSFFTGFYVSGSGYRENLLSPPDVQSTYYSLSSLDTLGWLIYNPNLTDIFNFIMSCFNADGGFGRYTNSTSSDFTSGWAAIKSLYILRNYINISESVFNNIMFDYGTWLNYRQGINSLFGHITVEYNYFGVLAVSRFRPAEFFWILDEDTNKVANIYDFLEESYDDVRGGYASQPGLNASLFSTYSAINIFKLLRPFSEVWYDPIKLGNLTDFLLELQNPDGGFKPGNDVEYIASLFGTYHSIVSDIINENISTTESTYWAMKSLINLGTSHFADSYNFTRWIRSCQNPDGGFSLVLGFYSDIVSTYYGLQIFREVLGSEPMSRMSVIEYLKQAQNNDGSFAVMPMMEQFVNLPSSFIVSYLGAISLYNYRFQPEDVRGLTVYFAGCFNIRTLGIGDQPGFGADLRNSPYAIIIVDELKYDQAFDSKPWTSLLVYMLLVIIGFIALYIFYRFFKWLSIPKRIKRKLGLGEKLSLAYLENYPAINCENLDIFAGRKLIVDSVSMRLEHGKILGILGESGAGKSTFVKGLLGMRKITGVCQIYGTDIDPRSAKKLRPIYGYVPQDLGKIYLNFTTYENLLYFGKQYGLTEKQILSRSKRILRSLGIEDKTHEYVRNLSGGQKRRVSIAIGLIHSPIFMILDEPTSGLDPIIRENLWLTLTNINEQFKTTLVVISHYPEESRFVHRVAIFGRGRGMIDFGKPKDLLDQLPGKGRSVEVTFNKVIENAIEQLESIDGIEKALENTAGTDYSLFTNLNLMDLNKKLEEKIGSGQIESIKQTDTQMEQFFRYKAMEVPKIDKV